MKRYLSYGGGINSTALMLLLIDEEIDFESVFVDHSTDYPETYEYVSMLINKGYPITVIKPSFQGFDSLYEYCVDSKMTPVRMMRWCTQHFKIEPLMEYCDKPRIEYVGIDADEPHRARPSNDSKINKQFPLVDKGIGRDKCIEIIKSHGLPVPPKSGCYICPFQRRSQWVELSKRNDGLWCKALAIEDISTNRQIEKGINVNYATKLPLRSLVMPKDARGRLNRLDQPDIFDEYKSCQCGL